MDQATEHIIIRVLLGHHQGRVLTRIPRIVSEAALQGQVHRGEVNHHQGIIHLPVVPIQVLTEVREVILFRREALILQALIVVLHREAADLPHHIAVALQVLCQGVLTPQDHPQDLPHHLHQVADLHHPQVVALREVGDSLKQ